MQHEDKISSYLFRNSDEDQLKELLEWAKSDEKNMDDIALNKHLWVVSGMDQENDSIDLEKEFGMLSYKLLEEDTVPDKPDKESGKEPRELVAEKGNKTRVYKRILKLYTKVAAVLLLPIMILAALQFFRFSPQYDQSASAQIVAPLGARIQFTLPDGTTGWLKNGSKLKYDVGFKNRQVSLVGEGYFDVVHKSDEKFEVIGADSKVVVLGTRFNVAMWPDENVTEVVLESGEVMFSYVGETNPTILRPDQKLAFNHTSKTLVVDETDPLLYSAWKDGTLIFRNDDMPLLAKKISRWYNVDVDYEPEQLKDFKFRATFKDKSLEEVLSLLELASPIRSEVIKGQELKDGTYTRTTIKIMKRES
jgi:ferric-dicitrate binding protein FerR (iron transport regulator)